MSLISSLNIGGKAIAASQLAIDITGQNISNANTEGYSRQRVSVSSESVRSQAFGEMGSGVEINNIKRIRNVFIDKQINEQNTEKGYYTQLDETLERVENVFLEPSDNSISNGLNEFFNAWQDLANNPSDLSSRQTVAATAGVLIGQFHTVATEIRNHKISINDDIEAHVNTVNELAREIQLLNDEIAQAEIQLNGNANSSRDQRELVLRKLSEEIEIDWIEDAQGRLTVTTSGNILVAPNTLVNLEMYRKTETEADGFKVSEVSIRFSNSKKPYAPEGGAVKALFDARDVTIPKYENYLDEVAKSLITSVNDVHQTGYNLNQDTGILFFNSEKLRASTISLSSAVARDANNIAAAKGGTAQAPTGGLVTGTLDASYPADMDVDLKDINPQYHDILQGTVSIKDALGEEMIEGAGQDYVVDYARGVISFINSAKFGAGDNFSIDFRYNDSGFAGKGDGDNALAIAQIREMNLTKPDADGKNTQSLGEYYSSFIGVLGIERNETKANKETRTFVVDQLKNKQADISGVSLDEELADMIKFEHSYQAAARYMSTISGLMDSLMAIAG